MLFGYGVTLQPQFDFNSFSLSATNPVVAPARRPFTATSRLAGNLVLPATTPLGRFLRRHSDGGDGLLLWRFHRRVAESSEAEVSLHGGYGQLLTDRSPGAWVGNGTAQEEPGCLFVATTLRF